ncbi:hypothetical protein [Nocardiopsis sp. SBT366]|uniref:hypothetical protein n=1 Tax=Nocardiopsis sp. SBT366 TaxID=1580529 RepID=UPI00066E1B40|nr:hypothetical protein [Nocardiopsis sp. SBT366]
MQKVNVVRNAPTALVPSVAGVTTLLPCLLFGSAAFLTWLGSRAAWLTLPTALGVPFAFPRLSLTTVVGQPDWHLATEIVAAAALAAVTGWWVRRALRVRPEANAWRVLLSAWAGVLLGLALANALRAVAAVLAVGAGPVALFAYALAGALTGLLWAVCLGWVCAVPAALVHRFTARTSADSA